MSVDVRGETIDSTLLRLRRFQRSAIVVGAGALALSAIGAVANPSQFFRSYLVAYLLWLGIALGCLGMGLVYRLTGGFWGREIHGILAAASATLPWLALLFLPICFGIHDLYVWSRSETAMLQHQQAYLNLPFFLLRSAVYLATWVVIARTLVNLSDRWEETGDPRVGGALRRLGALGLVALGLTASFAAIDWVMSLDPTWTSTMFPALVGAGDLLAGFAFAIAVVCWLDNPSSADRETVPRLLNDLGGLLLALVLLWAYLAFSQLLLIWAGNLNEEITWYVQRLNNGWQWVGAFVTVALFVVPFIALLSRDVKRSARMMLLLVLLLIVGRFVEVVLLVEPSFPPTSLPTHWLDLALSVGLGGVWLGAFSSRLRERIERASRG